MSHPQSAAWLRIVAEENPPDVQLGLIEATAQGDPLGFGFAKVEYQAIESEATLASLILSLCSASSASPGILFSRAEELPQLAWENLGTHLPTCRISEPASSSHGLAASAHSMDIVRRMHWFPFPPTPESIAGTILRQVLQRNNVLKPFVQAGRGLEEAFADPRMQTLSPIPGMRVVMALTRGTTGNRFADGLGDGLAERLWDALAPDARSRSSQPPDLPFQWHRPLMPFQQEGVEALMRMDRLLLSDDMGLGKTVQVVAALRILRARGEIRKCLVVAPASVLDQWRREIARWAPELRAIIIRGTADNRAWQWKARTDLSLVSYDVLRSDGNHLARARNSGEAWDAVVLDEAQRIKNRNDTSEVAKRLPRVRSWALTGTPIENNEEELASILEFVDYEIGKPRKRYRAGLALRQRHAELQLRRKKADVLDDLPEKLESKLWIPLHRDQKQSYDRAEREGIVYLKSLGREVGIHHVLQLITQLKQICNFDPRTGASSKLDDIIQRLRTLTAQGHRALVFSQYVSNTSGVAAAACALKEFHPLCLTGANTAEQRTTTIERFRNDKRHKVLVLSLRAGGLGLNLQEASYVFHLDRWWNPAVERQAEDRAHRLGQTAKVNVIKYTCENTIEDRIDRILEQKHSLFKELVDDVSLDLSVRFSRDELLGLFGLHESP